MVTYNLALRHVGFRKSKAQAQYEPMEYTPSGQVQHLPIEPGQDGQRIDNFLIGHLKGVPKTRIYRMLRAGEVRMDGRRVKADTRLVAGQMLRLPPVRMASLAAPDAEATWQLSAKAQRAVSQIQVLLETPSLLAIDKPAGLAVHGGSGVSLGVIEALREVRPAESLELVHRLDRDTSGLLLLAKSRPALLDLHRQLRDGHMRKRYLAVVAGTWPQGKDGPTSLIKAPLRKRVGGNGERMVNVSPDGQASMTRVRRLLDGDLPGFGPVTLVQAEPLTGRTHQIRVHLQHAGFPIVGDPKYGLATANAAAAKAGLKRLFLHAWRLAFDSPGLGAESNRQEIVAEPNRTLVSQLRQMGLVVQPTQTKDSET